MRIQWSGGTVQELLKMTGDADEKLNECLRRANEICAALAEANPDGENRTLERAEALFEQCTQRIRSLEGETGLFRQAFRRADRQFAEAETDVARMIEGLETAVDMRAVPSGGGAAYWISENARAMPAMRVRVTSAPQWLEPSQEV